MSTDNAKQRYEFKPGQRVILRKTGETGTVIRFSDTVVVRFDGDPPPQREWMIPAHKLDRIQKDPKLMEVEQ